MLKRYYQKHSLIKFDQSQINSSTTLKRWFCSTQNKGKQSYWAHLNRMNRIKESKETEKWGVDETKLFLSVEHFKSIYNIKQ